MDGFIPSIFNKINWLSEEGFVGIDSLVAKDGVETALVGGAAAAELGLLEFAE